MSVLTLNGRPIVIRTASTMPAPASSRLCEAAAPFRAHVHPALLSAFAPLPAEPEVDADRFTVRIYLHDRQRALAERRAVGRRIGAAALREALRECRGKRLDVAHLPFTYEEAVGRVVVSVRATMSVSVSESGTVCVDVSPWSGEAPFRLVSGAQMHDRAQRNRDGASAAFRPSRRW